MSATLDDVVQELRALRAALDRPAANAAPAHGDTMSEQEACAELGCKRRKLFELVREGKIRRVRKGKRNRYITDDVRSEQGLPSRQAGR